jgi:nitrile hydratase
MSATHSGHGHLAPSYFERFERALREQLVARGYFTDADVGKAAESFLATTPALGARVVARAWFDPQFKARLLSNGAAAVGELGIDVGDLRLVVVENTPEVHNLIVCTLCSCYPRPLLGLPPDWYKSVEYRSRAVREPRTVLAEFGITLPDAVTVRVHDSTADMRYLVLPMRPAGTEHLDEDACAALVTRDAMIGASLVRLAAAPMKDGDD